MTEDLLHRAGRWRAFYDEDGGIGDMLTGLRKAYFERASELPHRDTAGLQKLSEADKITQELERHILHIISGGDIAAAQKEHLRRIEKVGKFW